METFPIDILALSYNFLPFSGFSHVSPVATCAPTDAQSGAEFLVNDCLLLERIIEVKSAFGSQLWSYSGAFDTGNPIFVS